MVKQKKKKKTILLCHAVKITQLLSKTPVSATGSNFDVI